MRDERDPADRKKVAPNSVNDVEADTDVDPVEQGSEESFPASDPPSWEPLRTGPPARDHKA